jgi:hypothetical protein
VKGAGEWLGSLTTSLWLIPEQFTEPCAANPDAVIELAANGSVITMTSTGGEKGVRNNSLSSGYVSSLAAEAGDSTNKKSPASGQGYWIDQIAYGRIALSTGKALLLTMRFLSLRL